MTQAVLFDASRLLSRTERSAPTGVDRVCLAYAEWLIGRGDVRVLPVRSKYDSLVSVDEHWFRRCVEQLRQRWTGASAGPVSGPALSTKEADLFASLKGDEQRSVRDCPVEQDAPGRRRLRVWKQFVRSRRMPTLPDGEVYINVGHTSLNTPNILASLSSRGVKRIIFLHDLIPITHPEFCRPGDDLKHRNRVLIALRQASHILVNSEYTADELRAFAHAENLQTPPIDAVHLGLDDTFKPRAWSPPERPYFIHVGTIEARKNLAFLLTVWRRLAERLKGAAPRLILIGRYGWENEAVLDHLERSPALKGLVHQASNLPDGTIATLMANAQAVLAPSSVEGFDLPAVEAMALGVPLIASDIPAHRELVPNALLIDPLDGLGWLEALENATAKRPEAPPYMAPTWRAHFDAVGERLALGV